MRLAVICLARTGDLVNALGFCKHLHDAGNSVDFIVDARFRSVLLGVSYVNPVPVQFGLEAVPKAMKFAEGKYDCVLLAQTYGKHWAGSRARPYNVESWINCGFTEAQFADTEAFPLAFDRRDKDREDFLIRRHVVSNKPLMLIAVGCGKSSPFSSHHVFTASIENKWGKHFEIVNLCNVKAARIYDLLGLMERSKVMILGDSAPLHLATAVKAPVIALKNSSEWTGTRPRCKTLGVLPYRDALSKIRLVHAWIGQALTAPSE